MKICYLSNAQSIHTYKWVNYFAKKGHRIYLISLKPPKFDYGNVEVFLLKKIKQTAKISSHFINFLPALFQTKKILKKIDFEILHSISVAGEGWLAGLSGFHPLILTAAGTDVLTAPKESRLYKMLNSYVLKKADLITCDGEHTKEAMINLGAYPEKIKIIRFGVDIQKFKPQKMDDKFKESLFGGNFKIVISTKPLRSECDVETLVKAVPMILKEISEVRFVIAGEGEQKDYLMNLAKSLKIFEKIKFVGWISNDELPLYLNLADLFVSTSLVDSGLATSAAEAMACGVPLVVSDFGDNKTWIEEGKNGCIFPLKDSEILAKKIIYLLRHPELKEKFSKINRELIKERKNYDKEMAKMENLYQELIRIKK